MFLQLDGTFWVQALNFVIFFALLNVVFLRPVSQAIRRRREYINSVTNDYDRYQAQARDLRERAEAVRAAARRDAEQTLAKGRADASNEAAALATTFSEQATRTIDRAHRTALEELDAARAGEDKLVRGLADLMVERTVGEVAK